MPGNVSIAPQASEVPSEIVRPEPGIPNILISIPGAVNYLSLFEVLEGLKESVEPKEQLLIERKSHEINKKSGIPCTTMGKLCKDTNQEISVFTPDGPPLEIEYTFEVNYQEV